MAGRQQAGRLAVGRAVRYEAKQGVGRQLEYFVLYASKFRWPSAKFYADAQPPSQHQSNGASASAT